MGALELMNTIFGVISTLLTAGGLWQQFRKIDSVKALKNGVKSLSDMRFATPMEEHDLLSKCLDLADLIVPPLKRRLTYRFLALIAAIAGGSALVPVDFPGQISKQMPNAEPVDVAIFLFEIIAAVVASSGALLTPDEKEFLSNASALHARFYNQFVVPAIREFNAIVGSSHTLLLAKWEKEREDERTSALARRIQQPRAGA